MSNVNLENRSLSGRAVGETSKGAIHPSLVRFAIVLGIRVVRGTLTLVTTESTAKRLLTLRSLAHESTSALGAAKAASALRGHAEASKTRLHARRGLTVPSARRRLVTELAKRSGG